MQQTKGAFSDDYNRAQETIRNFENKIEKLKVLFAQHTNVPSGYIDEWLK
jgi:hypothetical protein